jgi:hypothetical protein
VFPLTAVNESGQPIHIADPLGQPFVIGVDAEIPPWAEHLLLAAEVPDADDAGADGESPADAPQGGGEAATPDANGGQPAGPPARAGKGGGVAAWRKYAAEHGVDGEGLDVDEIAAKLREAGVPVE